VTWSASVTSAALGLVLAWQAPAAADAIGSPAVEARLDTVAEAYTPLHRFMGAVLVVEGDHRLLDKGYGLADAEWGVANTPDVKFRIGSITKQFTAALVLLLQQDGKLSIQDPVSRYLPDAPASWRAITIAELLGHTSGIPDFVQDPDFRVWSQSPHAWPEELARFRDKPLNFAPGTRFDYSSSNYELLGAIIEKVSGESYGQLLRERIFGPLGMTNTGLDTDALILPKRAQGYHLEKDGSLALARSESMTIPWAAGGLYSTTGDLLKWEQGLFGGRLLSPASLKAMTTPGLNGYGLGVSVDTVDGLTTIDHGGAIEGFTSYLTYVPERGLTVVVLSNVGGLSGVLADQLLQVSLGYAVVLPNERPAQPISEQDLDRFTGTYSLKDAGLVVTFRRDGDVLESLSGGTVFPTIYEGVKDGHPTFYCPTVDSEITFIADAHGAMTSLILHLDGRDIRGDRP